MTERRSLILAGTLAGTVSLSAFLFFYRAGTILYFGDAVAHLNIARKLLDNKTTGWTQIGTVWLPLPHIVAAPFVAVDALWTSGIGGALPSLFAFMVGALFLFGLARLLLKDDSLVWASLGLYLTNLNLLYLQSTPMNEVQMMAAFLGAVYFALQRRLVPSACLLLAGTLIRYDAWFYIPFFAVYFWTQESLRRALLFTGICAIGPLLWIVHNLALYGNAMEWYSGPYSALAIQSRSIAEGHPLHPGYHSLSAAALYYGKAVQLVFGRTLVLLAVLGQGLLLRCSPCSAILWLPGVFYILSIAYGGVPLFMPQWWPFAYYNTRYAVQMAPAVALLAPAVVLLLSRYRRLAALMLILVVAGAWTLGVSRAQADAVLVFREAQINSVDRRYGVQLVARELRKGCTEIWLAGSDWTGALTAAGIPFRSTIHEGNHYEWRLTAVHPERMVDCVVAQDGDNVSLALARLPRFESSFRSVLSFAAPGIPRVRVFRRRIKGAGAGCRRKGG